jgi:hypothetical protein
MREKRSIDAAGQRGLSKAMATVRTIPRMMARSFEASNCVFEHQHLIGRGNASLDPEQTRLVRLTSGLGSSTMPLVFAPCH